MRLSDESTELIRSSANFSNRSLIPMITPIHINHPASSLKKSLALALVVACVPGALSAAVSTLGFTGGTGTASFDQYTGIAGGGWNGAWGSSGTASTVAVSSTTPIGSGGNYLSVINTNTTGDSPIYRQFDSTLGQSVTAAYQVSYSLRLDTLGNFNNVNDYISLSDSATSGGTSTTSSFFIRAFGAVSGTANAGVWAFYNGPQNGGGYNSNLWINSSMALTAGTTYSFTINIDPTTKTYSVSIFDGSTTATATGLGFRSNSFSGGSYLNFTTRNDAATTSDTIAYSLDNISVSAIPEPSTYAALAGLGVLGFAGYRRRIAKR